MNINSLNLHLVTRHFRARDQATWFWKCLGSTFGHFLVGLPFQGHNSWRVCKVALKSCNLNQWFLKYIRPICN